MKILNVVIFSPYKWTTKVKLPEYNYKRVAEVWMDEYKQYYYDRLVVWNELILKKGEKQELLLLILVTMEILRIETIFHVGLSIRLNFFLTLKDQKQYYH